MRREVHTGHVDKLDPSVDRTASWIVGEIQSLMRVRIFGDLIRGKLTNFLIGLDKKLREFGLDESKIGAISQEVYERLKNLLIKPGR